MRNMLSAVHGARLDRLFVAHVQSSLGTGAGYVVLVLLVYERFDSPWALTVILLAGFLPSMLVGPLLGALVDRWPRRTCAIAADLIRASAFVGIGAIADFAAMAALAFVAGAGESLFRPAILAGIADSVEDEDGSLAPVTSLYSAIEDLGITLGPALAGVALLIIDPAGVVLVNGMTFAVSALLLVGVDLDRHRSERSEELGRPSLLAATGESFRALRGMPRVNAVIVASSLALAFAAMINVAEVLLAKETLDAGDSGYSALVAVYGVGIVVGATLVSRVKAGGEMKLLLGGILLFGVATLGSGLAGVLGVALLTFTLAGCGEGLEGVTGRLILQRDVPRNLQGRVFAVKETAGSWGFGLAFVAGGALASLLEPGQVFLIAGAGAISVALATALVLRRRTPREAVEAVG
ncbi:MAG TPA: MFS transporter [Solirubrobacterales bacterium]|nr:MFS transporter [Solirubrobacterales bacterium]